MTADGRRRLAGQQAVDQHEAGDGREEVHQRNAARDGRPAEIAGEEDDEQQAPPEDRHGIADKRGAHDGLVEPCPAFDGGEHAGGNAEQHGKDDGTERELHRCREELHEIVEDGPLRDDGAAKIAGDEIAEVIQILDVKRPVEAEFVHDLRMALRRHHALARHQHHGIAGQEANEGEGNDGDPDEGRDQDGKPSEKKAKHGANIPVFMGKAGGPCLSGRRLNTLFAACMV